MKRLKLSLILILSLLLTGCIQEYKVTEEESESIAEYMAGLMLKYDKGYEETLIPMEVMTEEDSSDSVASDNSISKEEHESDAHTSDHSESDVEDTIEAANPQEVDNNSTLTEVIGVAGFTIQYSDYELADSYPEDPVNEGFYLEYNEGYQYLVASFAVKNTTDTKKEINLIKAGIDYQLKVNGTETYEPSLTLLENDLKYLDLNVAAGKSKKVLLIFKIPSASAIKNIELITTKDNKTVTIALRQCCEKESIYGVC